MFRINDMIDLPIIQDKSAQRICTVRDVIVDMREIRIYALVCREKLLRRFLEAVPFENVEEITQSSIIITGRICRIDLRQLEMKSRRFQSYGNILGKLVLNPRGEAIGIIRDLLVDTNSGIIEAYELSEGYIDDIIKGRHIVELGRRSVISAENIPLKDQRVKYWFDNSKEF